MGQLEDMALLTRIVEAGGIGKAAEQLNLAKSAVSRRLTELEKQLGTQLLSRTTRKSNLTDAGLLYYQKALTILNDVAELNAHTRGIKTAIEGTLKMTAPLSFGLLHLTPIIDEFSKKYPNLNIHIDFSDRHIDLIEEGYELAIRVADLKDSSLKAKRITPIQHMLCASPDYLLHHGMPTSLAELSQHQFLLYGQASINKLLINDPQGKPHSLHLTPKIKANNGDFLIAMAIKGQGIVFSPTFISYQAIATGQLVQVLADHSFPPIYAYAVYPQTRFLSQRCRLLIDFIVQRLGDEPYWDKSLII